MEEPYNNTSLQVPTLPTAVYTRVSTEEQAMQGYSLDAQLAAAMKYIETQPSLGFVEHYTDPGISGKNISGRPGLKRLLNDVTNGKIKAIVVWKNSRLTRSLKDLLTIMDTVASNNVTLYSVSEGPVVDNATGRLQVNLLAALNQYERENIAENVRSGMARRAQEGYYNTRAPLGYNNEVDESGTPSLVVVPEEAKIVRAIFEEYTKHGKGYKAIANKLNNLGYKTKRGNDFSIDSVKRILLNPVYVGKIRWGQYENWEKYRRSRGKSNNVITAQGKHEAIISEEMWAAREKRTATATKTPAWDRQGTNVLTGVLRCPACGSGMVRTNSTGKKKDGTRVQRRYYSCGAWVRKGSAVCSANSIRVEEAEQLVEQRILEVLSLTHFGQDVVNEMNDAYKAKKEELRTAITNKETDKRKILENISKYQIMIDRDPALSAALTNTIEAQRRTLESVVLDIETLNAEREALLSIPSQATVETALQIVADSAKEARGNKAKLKELYKKIVDNATFDKKKRKFFVNLKLDKDIVAELKDRLAKGESIEGSPFFAGLIRVHL